MPAFLYSGLVKFILIVVGCLGLVLAFKKESPKKGLIIALAAFLLLFVINYLQGQINMTNFLLALTAGLLVLTELMIPGFMGFALAALVFLILAFQKGSLDMDIKLNSLSFALIFTVILAIYLIKERFSKENFSKLVLKSQDKGPEKEDDLIGKTALTSTILRPSGIVEMEGKRYDASSEGEFIDKGKEVIVIRTEGKRLFVKEYK